MTTSLRRGQLRRCGPTDNDHFAHPRQSGVRQLNDLRYVLYEAKGGLMIVREDGDPDAELVDGRPALRAPSAFTDDSREEREPVDRRILTIPGVAAVSGLAGL